MRPMTLESKSTTGFFNDVIRCRKYFGTDDAVAASVIQAKDYLLFRIGQGEIDKNMSTNEDVTLLDCDSSLFGNQGIIPNAESFTVYGIGVDIHLSNYAPSTPFEGDSVTDISIVPQKNVNPYPLVDTLRSQSTFELWRNSTELLEQGNLADYPCGLSITGFAGGTNAVVPALAGGVQDTYDQDGMVFVQNGLAFRPLTVYQNLASLDQFYGKLKVCRQITLTTTQLVGYIDFLLVGRASVNRTAKQLTTNFLG